MVVCMHSCMPQSPHVCSILCMVYMYVYKVINVSPKTIFLSSIKGVTVNSHALVMLYCDKTLTLSALNGTHSEFVSRI